MSSALRCCHAGSSIRYRIFGGDRPHGPPRLLMLPRIGVESALDTLSWSGAAVTDADALAQMDIPGHETCIEVGKVRESGADETAARRDI